MSDHLRADVSGGMALLYQIAYLYALAESQCAHYQKGKGKAHSCLTKARTEVRVMAKGKATKSKPVFTAYYTDSQYIVETVYQNQAPRYAILSSKGIRITGQVTIAGQVYMPYADPMNTIRENAVLLPTQCLPYGSKAALLNDIQQYIHDFCDMPPFWE